MTDPTEVLAFEIADEFGVSDEWARSYAAKLVRDHRLVSRAPVQETDTPKALTLVEALAWVIRAASSGDVMPESDSLLVAEEFIAHYNLARNKETRDV